MVDTAKNTWCDFGLTDSNGHTAGGDAVDFVKHYTKNNDTRAALAWLEKRMKGLPTARIKIDNVGEKYVKTDYTVKPLQNTKLLQYLAQRGIRREIATRYCEEVWFDHDKHFGVAFPTKSDYEMRNPWFKRCMTHKDISYIPVHKGMATSDCCVFEGFMDFLSYVTLFERHHPLALHFRCDSIVLNSTSCVCKALPELVSYATIHCYLDNDDAGHAATGQIRSRYPRAVIDESNRYSGVNDVNAYLMKILGLKESDLPSNRKA